MSQAIELSAAQLLEALDFAAPDRETDNEQLETLVKIQSGVGHGGQQVYCWLSECPEEGSTYLTGEGVTADPWMDIGTAPRDGRKVLVRRNEEVEPVTVAYWSMAECRFVTPLCNHYHEPTHWMPMPGVSK